uniref:Large ribosomal subunit protein uL15m n=1 Tax=Moschus moschiferus TaxID=68415 RepID=A0A8C6FGG5_MOSMO
MAGLVRGTAGPWALDLLQALPRVSLANLKPNPGSRKPERRQRGQRRGRKCGRGHKGERQRGTRLRLGFEGGQTPFYLRIPKYGLNRLQYLIDLGRVDPTQPIDLTQLVNGRGVTIQPSKKDCGVQLVEKGADTFKAKVNIEVQLASEEWAALRPFPLEFSIIPFRSCLIVANQNECRWAGLALLSAWSGSKGC